jgi:hypothetical protein
MADYDDEVEKPCYAGFLCNCWWTVPLGGIVGLAGSAYGFFTYLNPGFSDAADALNDMGVDTGDLVSLVDSASSIFFLANVLVVLYGLREKCRTRLNILAHRTEGSAAMLKFLFKTAIHLCVIGSVALVVATFVYMEALYIMLVTIKAICTGSEDALEAVIDILDIFGGGGTDTTEICDAAGSGRDGALKCFIGSVILIVTQTIIYAYWMKYSTLANVPAYWTTGKYAKNELEMKNASNI